MTPAATLDSGAAMWEDSPMARTNRSIPTDSNHREARHGAVNREAAWKGAHRRTFHGGMVMSPHASGAWDDERQPSGSRKGANARAKQRRAAKRRERREAMRQADES